MLLVFFILLFFIQAQGAGYFDPPDTSKPLLRMLEFQKQRAYPGQDIPNYAYKNALIRSKSASKKYSTAKFLSQQPEWKCIGPFDIGGRIKSIAPHPADRDIWYVAAAAGGIWKTTDLGGNWKPVFDNENSIAFGSLSINPKNPDIIYAATGEAVMGSGNVFNGSGIYRSSDAGENWELTGLTEAGAFSKIFVHPHDTSKIVAGAIKNEHGFYVSTNSGKSWKKKLDKNITDVSFNPGDKNDYVVGVNGEGVYRTYNSGDSWTKLSQGFPKEGLGRISVQFAPSDVNIIYALSEVESGMDAMIFKSTNGGKQWHMMFKGGYDFFNGQGFYNNFILVHPENPDIAFAGGIYLWRTSNGGKNWENISDRMKDGTVMHVDQHHAAFSPADRQIIMTGNDGGVYVSVNSGSYWSRRNNNLMVTQFYSFTPDKNSEYRIFGGTQDNGTLGSISDENWAKFAGGDGFDVIIDPYDPNIIYGEFQYGRLWKLVLDNNKPVSFYSLGETINNDEGAWHSPLVADPADKGVFYHGRSAIYASYLNKGEEWTRISERSQVKYTAIGVSSVDNKIIYAGDQTGNIIISSNAGKKWENADRSSLINRYITDIKPSLFDKNTVYVSYSGFGSPHVFKSTDLGKSWKDISGTLPDIPCNELELHPENEKIIFAATDIGVYATYDGGNIWLPFGKGLPNSPVMDIEIKNNNIGPPGYFICAATYGRSIWEADLPQSIITEPEIIKPAGGEVYTGGYEVDIIWNGFTSPFNVYYSSDDGQSWIKIASDLSGNQYKWNLPENYSFHSRIKVQSKSSGVSKISPSFTVKLKEKGDIISSKALSYSPYGIAAKANKRLYVNSFYEAKIYVYKLPELDYINELNVPRDFEITGLTGLDYYEDRLYVHTFDSKNGNAGKIIIMDTLGSVLKKIGSPVSNYPMGLAVNGDDLFITERDGEKRIFKMGLNNYEFQEIGLNPYTQNYGPRCLIKHENNFYQVCTAFPNDVLTEAFIGEIDLNFNSVKNIISLNTQAGSINARGLEIAATRGDFWVSGFRGDLYKIAGSDANVGIKKEIKKSDISLYPIPATDIIYFTMQYEGKLNYKLYNITGEKIKSGIIADKKIVVNDLNYGFYFIILSNENGFFERKKILKISN